MNKNTIILIAIAVIIIALGLGGYFYWKKSAQTPEQKAIENVTQSALPDYGTQTEPLQKMPDVNPATKTNPYKTTKTNPFE
ncbi:MAG: hypothetical protein QMD86_00660 [Patescibacteria group bacterium]|nr:hypothetical protein [Patescibacteria group bacterium]